MATYSHSSSVSLSCFSHPIQHIDKSITIYLYGKRLEGYDVMCEHGIASQSVFKRWCNRKATNISHSHSAFFCLLSIGRSSIMSKRGEFRQIVMDQFSDDQVWQSFRPIYLYAKFFGYWPSTYKVIYFLLSSFDLSK